MHKVVHLKFPRRHDRIRKTFPPDPGFVAASPLPLFPGTNRRSAAVHYSFICAHIFHSPPLLFSAQKLVAPKERESISSSSSSFLLAFTSSDGPRFSKRRRGKRRRESAKTNSAREKWTENIRRSFLNLLLSARREELLRFFSLGETAAAALNSPPRR